MNIKSQLMAILEKKADQPVLASELTSKKAVLQLYVQW